MFIQKSQMVATLYTVIFHSPQAAAAFEIEVELRAGVFNLKRSITSVSFGLFEPIAGELWAKDFEARWIARLESEMHGHGDPATPLAITNSYQEPYHGPIDHVEDLLITKKMPLKQIPLMTIRIATTIIAKLLTTQHAPSLKSFKIFKIAWPGSFPGHA